MDPLGTQALQLRDIHLPPAPPWWPPAPGWWLLGLLLVILLAVALRWLLRAWRQHRRRQQLRAMLDEIERGLSTQPAPQRLAALSALLKRVALQRYRDASVGSLSGNAWLAFLDRTGGGGAFSNGPGRVLAEGAYRASLDAPLDVSGLMRAARDWVRRNLGGPA